MTLPSYYNDCTAALRISISVSARFGPPLSKGQQYLSYHDTGSLFRTCTTTKCSTTTITLQVSVV